MLTMIAVAITTVLMLGTVIYLGVQETINRNEKQN